MLTLYHTPISANSRRVWIALLEKEIPFELVSLNLDGDQFHLEFLTLIPSTSSSSGGWFTSPSP